MLQPVLPEATQADQGAARGDSRWNNRTAALSTTSRSPKASWCEKRAFTSRSGISSVSLKTTQATPCRAIQDDAAAKRGNDDTPPSAPKKRLPGVSAAPTSSEPAAPSRSSPCRRCPLGSRSGERPPRIRCRRLSSALKDPDPASWPPLHTDEANSPMPKPVTCKIQAPGAAPPAPSDHRRSKPFIDHSFVPPVVSIRCRRRRGVLPVSLCTTSATPFSQIKAPRVRQPVRRQCPCLSGRG